MCIINVKDSRGFGLLTQQLTMSNLCFVLIIIMWKHPLSAFGPHMLKNILVFASQNLNYFKLVCMWPLCIDR